MKKSNWLRLCAQAAFFTAHRRLGKQRLETEASEAVGANGSRLGRRKLEDAKQLDRVSVAIASATLSGILALTLFPYDFFIEETIADFTWAALRARAHRPILMPMEFLANVVMFLPLGFGCALRLRRNSSRLPIVLGISLATTLTVETLQIFLPSRTPTHIDLLSNTLGGGFGFVLWRYWQPFMQSRLILHLKEVGTIARLAVIRPLLPYWQMVKPKPRVQRAIAALSLCLYCCFTLWGTASLRSANLWGLSNWDPSYPLLLGNELEGNRPWNGQISNVQIYAQQLESADVQQLLNQPESVLDKATPIAHYPLNGDPPYSDEATHLPALAWQGQLHKNFTAAPFASFSPQRWLETQSPPTHLVEQVKAAKAFTISLMAQTGSNQQDGPARILSLSKGPLLRNLTIGQKGSHLSLRLRTPITKENGQRPEFIVPNVFSVATPHHLVLTYSVNKIELYVDTLASGQKLRFSPEMTFFWQLAPPVLSTIQFNSVTVLICQLVYRGIWLIPIGVVLLITTILPSENRGNSRQFQLSMVAISILSYGLLERLLH